VGPAAFKFQELLSSVGIDP